MGPQAFPVAAAGYVDMGGNPAFAESYDAAESALARLERKPEGPDMDGVATRKGASLLGVIVVRLAQSKEAMRRLCLLGAVMFAACATSHPEMSSTGQDGPKDAAVDAPVPSPDASTPRDGSAGCREGYYLGKLSGEYASAVLGMDAAPRPLGSGAQDGVVSFLYTRGEDSGVGCDCSSRPIRNGCWVGEASGEASAAHPFAALLLGELDCPTGSFTGVLRGEYRAASDPGSAYAFEGPVTATYDFGSHKLQSGVWQVLEGEPFDYPPGGSGTWSATWAGEPDSAPPLPAECEALRKAAE